MLKNIPNRDRKSPLYYAIELGNLDFIQLLLEKGVDLNARYEDGHTILHYMWYDRKELDAIVVLVNKGPDVNAVNVLVETPLHSAIACGSLEYAEFLLARGASVNVVNIEGHTPLHVAVKTNHAVNLPVTSERP